jgi:hypothetical protein
MKGSEDSEPRIALIEGKAVIHQAFGGAGPASRLNTPRANAHGALMRCTDSEGGPAPKCVDGAGSDGIAHTMDCDHATGLLEQLRSIFGGAK